MTDIIQTVAVVLALLFTGLEMRSRVLELRFSNYLNAMSGFVDLGRLMVEQPVLHSIYDYSTKGYIGRAYAELTADQRCCVHYCDALIALCETVWVASEEHWISGNEWTYWKDWVAQLHHSECFVWTVDWVAADYDPKFIQAIRHARLRG